MPSSVTIRECSPDDDASVAALVQRAAGGEICDFESATVEDLRAFDQSLARAGSRVMRRGAFDQHGRLVGFAQHFHVPWTARANLHWCVVRVDPHARRQGLGRALCEAAAAQARAAGGATLAVEVRAGEAAVIAACLRHGLREAFRSLEFACDPRGFDPRAHAAAWERLASQGLEIVTLPELQRSDPDWLASLHELYVTLARDVPIPERATLSPEQLGEYIGALPEACFVALDGSAYAGISFMQAAQGAAALIQKLTGVRAGYRGRGVALALKLRTLDYANAHGYERIVTWIETNNPAMLALSARLGFRQGQDGIVVLELEL
jgi:GNAT superfamily N-acetyltransferase